MGQKLQFKRKIRDANRSLTVAIPPEITILMGITKGDDLIFEPELDIEGHITTIRIKSKRKFNEMTPEALKSMTKMIRGIKIVSGRNSENWLFNKKDHYKMDKSGQVSSTDKLLNKKERRAIFEGYVKRMRKNSLKKKKWSKKE